MLNKKSKLTPAELERHARALRTRTAKNAEANALATTGKAWKSEREKFEKLLKASEELNKML